MKVGVLGTGVVGRALGSAFIALGHEVKMGAREAGNAKAAEWAGSAGKGASAGTFAEAAESGELIVIATLGEGTISALDMAGPEKLKGKIVLDTTNPLDHSAGMPPKLFVGHKDSLGEMVQRALPGARVVKCFNTVGNALMFRPKLQGGPADMFIAGNDEGAKQKVKALLKDFGWNTADIGGIEGSRYLEPMCLAWVLHGIKSGSWNHAFKFVRT